jgi:hypothetical protein
MQNHRPARSRRKRVHIPLDGAIHINPTHNGPADGGAMHDESPWDRGLSDPCRLDDRPGPAADPVSVGRRPAAAGRAFARRHPAADPGAGCLAAAGSASVGSGCSCALSSRIDGLPPDVNAWNRRKLRRKTSNARANFARYRCQFPPKFRRELKTGHTDLHPLLHKIGCNLLQQRKPCAIGISNHFSSAERSRPLHLSAC